MARFPGHAEEGKLAFFGFGGADCRLNEDIRRVQSGSIDRTAQKNLAEMTQVGHD